MKTHFTRRLRVEAKDIDTFNHVNNEVYLSWIVGAAMAHSESVGFSNDYYVQSGAAFVVRRHELDYLASAILGDEVEVETWICDHSGATTTREYLLKRVSDQKILMKAKTLWVYINLKTGRPLRIPHHLIEAFGAEHL